MSIMRKLFFIFCMFCIIVPLQARHNQHIVRNNGTHRLKIKYVTIKRMSDGNFKTLPELFSDRKKHERMRCVVRDNDSNRNGLYFIVGVNKCVGALPEGCSIKISMIGSLKDDKQIYTLSPIECRPSYVSEIFCGITSLRIHEKDIVAWKVEILDIEGNVIASKKSYMWK